MLGNGPGHPPAQRDLLPMTASRGCHRYATHSVSSRTVPQDKLRLLIAHPKGVEWMALIDALEPYLDVAHHAKERPQAPAYTSVLHHDVRPSQT